MNKRQSTGFTLIELMITIAILAIMAVMAVPSFTNLINSYQLNQGADQMLAALKEGRSRAAALRSSVIVCPNKNASNQPITLSSCLTAAGITASTDITSYTSANRVIVAGVSPKTSITVTSLFTRFSPTGTSANNTISLCQNGNGWDVGVDILGAVSKTKKGSGCS